MMKIESFIRYEGFFINKKYVCLIILSSYTLNINYSCIFSIEYYNVNNNNNNNNISMKKSLIALALIMYSSAYANYTVVFGKNDNIRFTNIEVTEPEIPVEPEVPEEPVEPKKDNRSCKTLLVETPSLTNGVYDINSGNGDIPMYCDMSGGGWTLVAVGIRYNIAGWATSDDLNLTAAPSTSVGFRLADNRINSLPKNVYKVTITGKYATSRYFNGSCHYNHTVSATGACIVSYSNEALNAGVKVGSQHPEVTGLSDYNTSTATRYVMSGLIGASQKAGWGVGDGKVAANTANAVAGDGGNIQIWLK
jgi:hypothetical protein